LSTHAEPAHASAPEVLLLSGGTGGAKLARGLAGVLAPEQLTVIANTGDDIGIYGALVSPDPDLVTFWLADAIDERGWGLREDTFAVMDALRALGADVWFNLGDRDLAWCIERSRMLADGLSASAAHARLSAAIGVRSAVLPMSEQPVHTWVSTPAAGWRGFQEFMIRGRAEGPIDGLEYRGAEQAAPSAEVLAAIAAARTIVIGPSNPLASIGPILALPGMRDALIASPAPVVAVSPIVAGEVLKGPTAAFMAYAKEDCSAAGVAALYADLLDGIVADEDVADVPCARIDTRMHDDSSRRDVAEQVLAFVRSLTR
jgi:LPPG:FO 2-phospho-L-lactate transferase